MRTRVCVCLGGGARTLEVAVDEALCVHVLHRPHHVAAQPADPVPVARQVLLHLPARVEKCV